MATWTSVNAEHSEPPLTSSRNSEPPVTPRSRRNPFINRSRRNPNPFINCSSEVLWTSPLTANSILWTSPLTSSGSGPPLNSGGGGASLTSSSSEAFPTPRTRLLASMKDRPSVKALLLPLDGSPARILNEGIFQLPTPVICSEHPTLHANQWYKMVNLKRLTSRAAYRSRAYIRVYGCDNYHRSGLDGRYDVWLIHNTDRTKPFNPLFSNICGTVRDDVIIFKKENARVEGAVESYEECYVDVHEKVETPWFIGSLLDSWRQCRAEIYQEIVETPSVRPELREMETDRRVGEATLDILFITLEECLRADRLPPEERRRYQLELRAQERAKRPWLYCQYDPREPIAGRE